MSTSSSQEHISTKFLELCKDNYLEQHVTKPTRCRESDTPSILDLIFTDEKSMIDTIEHNAPLGNSDHDVLEFVVRIPKSKSARVCNKIRYAKGNYKSMTEELALCKWVEVLSRGGIDRLWMRFTETLSNVVEKYIPVSKSCPNNFNTPWMNHETLKVV